MCHLVTGDKLAMPDYKNRIQSPAFVEHTIVDQNNAVVGTIRIKPSSILWKPSNARSFHGISLDRFKEWVTSKESGSKRIKS